MTPNFLTGLALANPTAEPVHLILETTEAKPSVRSDLGYASIIVGSKQQAQGPVLKRYLDGRITIDAGGRSVTGYPIRLDEPRGFWARISSHLI